jgi:hypothetical protein
MLKEETAKCIIPTKALPEERHIFCWCGAADRRMFDKAASPRLKSERINDIITGKDATL